MKALRRFLVRLTASIKRGRDEKRLRDEIEEHLALQTAENIKAGISPDEARRQAVLKFGAVEVLKEDYRDQRSLRLLENLLHDVRYALRGLRTNPGFTAVAVVTLALGIGATTAIFSVVHGVLIQPLPYPRADALMGIYNRLTISGQVYEDAALSPGMYAACRNDCRAFEHFGVWSSGAATVTGAGEPEQVATVTVTHGVLPAFGIPASLGAAGSRRKTIHRAVLERRSSAMGTGNKGSEATGRFSAVLWSSISLRTRSSA